jgi:cation:H+ antiporter
VSIARQLAILAFGIAALAVAARFVVRGAEEIAASLGVPELIIGLTILALGTSAPEIVTTLIAALQGRRELAIGNAVGSNIFNILLVLGATSTFAPDGIAIGGDAVTLDLPIMVAAAVACLPVIFWDHKLDRWEGGVFVAYYVAYLVFLTLDATGHRASDPFVFVLTVFVMPLTVLTVGIGIFRQRRTKTVVSISS